MQQQRRDVWVAEESSRGDDQVKSIERLAGNTARGALQEAKNACRSLCKLHGTYLSWESCEAAGRCLQADDSTGNYGRLRHLAVLGETHGSETNWVRLPVAGLLDVAFAVVAAFFLAYVLCTVLRLR